MPKVELSFHAQRTFLCPTLPRQLEFTSAADDLQVTIKVEDTARIVSETAEVLTKDLPIVVPVPAVLHEWGRPSGMWFAVHVTAVEPREPSMEPFSVFMVY